MNKDNTFIELFWKAFSGSKCKTALLVISILIVFTFCLTELLKVFYEVRNEGLRDIVMCVILFWIGRASKQNGIK